MGSVHGPDIALRRYIYAADEEVGKGFARGPLRLISQAQHIELMSD